MQLHPDVTNKKALRRFETLEADFQRIHKRKYDYSKTFYKTTNAPITIICKQHGEFEQRPNDHLRGKGCKQCAIDNSKSDIQSFIAKAVKVHGDTYDYSSAVYTGSKEKIVITCKKHGEFEQRADHHLSGEGCSRCSNKIPTNTEFIQKAQKIHEDKYNYEKVEYVNNATPITIVCSTHGEFSQRPNDHLNGNGCPKCAGNIKKSTEEFINDAKIIHGATYDYSKVNYLSNSEQVTIICPQHGLFDQTPIIHLRGSGCPKCGNNIRNNEEFIQKAISIHGNKYDYSKTQFRDSREHITIICKEHGEFSQIAGNHLLGKGCSGCAIGGFDTHKPAILYYLSVDHGQAYKIGITNKSIKKRYSKSERERIKVIKTWKYTYGKEALEKETAIKNRFQYAQYKGKDLLESGNSELFTHDILNLDNETELL